MAIFDKKKEEINCQLYGIFFLQFLVIKTLDPDPDSDSLEMLDLDLQHWYKPLYSNYRCHMILCA